MNARLHPVTEARIKEICPGFYTERDGGDWYVVAPDTGRVAEGFSTRRAAQLCLLWLAGEALPYGWSFTKIGRLSIDLFCGQGMPATIWRRDAVKHSSVLRNATVWNDA